MPTPTEIHWTATAHAPLTTERGKSSDVCLKRKIRNRLLDAGYAVFVQSDDRRIDECRSLKERAESCPELKACMDAITSKKKTKDAPVPTRDDYAAIACKTWIDVRAFGQVFSFKKGGDAEGCPSAFAGLSQFSLPSALLP